VHDDRHLDWSGCWNARDLGGFATAGGLKTRWAAAVRADALDGLTTAGWAALWDHGVRTVIDLRNDDERAPDAAPRPDGITTIHLPLDAYENREFWAVWASGPQFGTPLYYRPHLERFPERTAAVLAAIATAMPGGVAFHCGGGRDRAGQITMVLLALLGVAPRDIAADYMLSYERLPARYAPRGEGDQAPHLQAFLKDKGTTASDVIVDTVESLDIESLGRIGGLTDRDLITLRDRLTVKPFVDELDLLLG
jgi:protein-tyrosine phosphatase